mmetsp:Transcript_69641/g.131073  ORF Transcript_69641/g.131073 Transcript_69641/m.131073 type:complete len:337 (+) Transcript_69641:181-1191(+)
MLKGETAEDMVARLSTTGDPSSESVWTFGFGSNMNVALLQSKKGMTVLESSPAVVKEWRLSFAMNAIGLVEPAFADAQPGRKEDEIHGVAVRLPLADYARLSKQEASYAEVEVVAAAYDGRTLEVRMYTKPLPAQMKGGAPPVDIPCSQRYLNVLVSGGVEAGLDKDYIRRLSERPTYAPSPETLARRVAMLPPPETLPPFTVAELCEGYADPPRGSHDPSNVATGAVVRTAVLGYVLELPRPKIFFGSHRGRDVTARQSRQWRGISLDENDDLGAPPFPSLSAMPPDELEFVKHWLDHYLQNATVVGYLVEFREQLERERTVRGDNLNAPLVTFP